MRIYAAIILIILICGWPVLTTHHILKDLPDKNQIFDTIEKKVRTSSTLILDDKDRIIAELSVKRKIPVTIDEIPDQLIQAFLHAEDQHFFTHGPLSFSGIFRAAWFNLRNQKRIQGGSTITQQLARIFFLGRKKTFHRKILEIGLSFRLESLLSKDQILSLYLNHVYLGRGAYGVEAAAHVYFGKRCKDLNIAESALLAALPRAPSKLAPHKYPEQAVQKRNLVLDLMKSSDYLTDEQWKSARQEPLHIRNMVHRSPPDIAWMVARIKDQLRKKWLAYGNRQRGLIVTTAIDRKKNLSETQKLSSIMKKLNHNKQAKEIMEVAHICVNIRTSLISCMQGSVSFQNNQFNRVYRLKRSPGTLILPAVYAYARLNGQFSYPHIMKGFWDDLYYGEFRQSRTLVSLLGFPAIAEFMENIGFSVDSSAEQLTDIRTSPAHIADIMLSIFQGEQYQKSRIIASVRDDNGTLLSESSLEQKQKIFPDHFGYLIRSFMKAKTREGRPYNGITGVSEDLQNGWFAGKSGETLHVLWIGSEYGRSRLGKTKQEALTLIGKIAEELFPDKDSDPSDYMFPEQKNMGFHRYTDRRGALRTVPFITL
ncbi:MAG: transglycosylase domain-containing protein [Deltaproteobacteria bacterium]|nr:transglycosylase domain-containing protein [Deltaproteobacteria bacterium]